MQQIILCPQCGAKANYILTNGFTITACSECYSGTIADNSHKVAVVRVDRDKFLGQAAVQRDLLMIALTAEALYKNWDIITRTYVPMAEG